MSEERNEEQRELDETVVVDRRAGQSVDETVVVHRAALGERDDTVVVARRPSDPVDDRTVDDTTVVASGVARGRASGDDAAKGVGRRARRRAAERAAERDAARAAEAARRDAAPSGDETAEARRHGSVPSRDRGMDPTRRIRPAPGTNPWDAQPEGERGVAQGLPVRYGARTSTQTEAQRGLDEVQRTVGPPPPGSVVPVRTGRQSLPSLERRDRRRRIVTLVLYGATVVLCVLGLWGVATLAFG